MEDIKEILKRLEKLESIVYGQDYEKKEKKTSTLEEAFSDVVNDINNTLEGIRNNFEEDDSFIFQAVFHNETNTKEYQLTSLKTLEKEEKDDDIEALCNVLASKQRICILRSLTKDEYSSGELVELTKMAGGHLHHHLKELLLNKFIFKTESGKYKATRQGLNVYLTIAALNRRLKYDERAKLNEENNMG